VSRLVLLREPGENRREARERERGRERERERERERGEESAAVVPRA